MWWWDSLWVLPLLTRCLTILEEEAKTLARGLQKPLVEAMVASIGMSKTFKGCAFIMSLLDM